MKKLSISKFAVSGMILMMLIVTLFQTQSIAAPKNPVAQVKANIPSQWQNNIIKEQNGAVTSFSLVNGDSAPVFLFSVTEIPEQEWIKTKAQLTGIKLLEHKDGNIYFSYKNQKEKVKGACSELYQQIYPMLDQLISEIEID